MLIFDLESNGLLDAATKIHCVSLLDTVSGKAGRYHHDPSITPRDGSLLDGLFFDGVHCHCAGLSVDKAVQYAILVHP